MAILDRVRPLRPHGSFPLTSGLWLVDAFQPVAAVLDPDDGALRGIVDWREVPPDPAVGDPSDVAPRRVFAGGDALWVQEHPQGALVRVDAGGVTGACWTQGLVLTAGGPDAAWCSEPPPDQELVRGADGRPVALDRGGTVLRVGRDGAPVRAYAPRPVLSIVPTPGGALVEVRGEEFRLRPIGEDVFDVEWSSDWLLLEDRTLTADRPVTVDTHGVDAPPPGPEGEADGGEAPWPDAVRDRVLADPIDISAHRWPLGPRPVELDSYLREALRRNENVQQYWHPADGGPAQPLADGPDDVVTDLVGEWPDTMLQWTFTSARYPGLRLRRRVRLFDELGRIAYPQYADVSLMEDLAVGPFPDPGQAVDGVLPF